jgi:RNA polymerase sigma-70 factor (ECF subfamily)
MPVFRFIRRNGCEEEVARDLTQGFFAQLLARNGLDTVDPCKGRFRSFLLGAVKHFLADQMDRVRAVKRGGGEIHVQLHAEPGATTSSLQIPDPVSPPPDTFFDRQWAFNVIERALKRLSLEFAAAEKTRHFETLKPWLVGELTTRSQAEAGQQLGLTEGAVKVAIHRLRKQFRELVKAEVGQTVGEAGQVQEELGYLVEVLSQSGT